VLTDLFLIANSDCIFKTVFLLLTFLSSLRIYFSSEESSHEVQRCTRVSLLKWVNWPQSLQTFLATVWPDNIQMWPLNVCVIKRFLASKKTVQFSKIEFYKASVTLCVVIYPLSELLRLPKKKKLFLHIYSFFSFWEFLVRNVVTSYQLRILWCRSTFNNFRGVLAQSWTPRGESFSLGSAFPFSQLKVQWILTK